MNPLLLPHEVQWVRAAPLWPGADADRLARPAILRFAGDDFMQELASRLSAERPSLEEATPEAGKTLKLYQPAHGRFYLVASHLVCRTPGLPDHVVDLGHEERVGYVLRRVAAGGGGELALTGDARAPRWVPVTAGAERRLGQGEQVTPLFPMTYTTSGRSRRLHAALLPTAAQDQLESAPVGEAPAAEAVPPDDEWSELVALVQGIDRLRTGTPAAKPAQSQEASRVILADVDGFLARYMQPVWQALRGGPNPTAPKASALLALLRTTRVHDAAGVLLSVALPIAAEILLGTRPESDLDADLSQAGATLASSLEAKLAEAIQEAHGGDPRTDTAPPPKSGSTRYRVRCVYRRPHCGLLRPDLLSEASDEFVIAPFFDADAPARPIRISLPIQPTLAGLRKFKKNVRVLMPDALRNKIAGQKIDPLEVPSLDCNGGFAFSIPIITLCAMILLFIIITLLHLIFWWLPFVKICLPRVRLDLE